MTTKAKRHSAKQPGCGISPQAKYRKTSGKYWKSRKVRQSKEKSVHLLFSLGWWGYTQHDARQKIHW